MVSGREKDGNDGDEEKKEKIVHIWDFLFSLKRKVFVNIINDLTYSFMAWILTYYYPIN